MRLFLDAHISGKKVGRALQQAGYDVRAADDPALEGWEDHELFELATLENRIFVTSNAKHFIPLARHWIDTGRTHAGLILLPPTLRHEHFGKIIARVDSKLSGRTQEDWKNRTEWA